MTALVVLLLIFAAGALAHVIAPYGYNEINLKAAFAGKALPPRLTGFHIFGTDEAGKDLFSQTLYGIETSVEVALAVAAAATLVGIVIGALAGYYRGWIDTLLTRTVDIAVTIPAIFALLVAVALFPPQTPFKVGVALSALLWVQVARVIRASCVSLREEEYVEAARAAGASDVRIVARHVLPNTVGPVLVAFTSIIGQAILLEATIDFFGYGVYSAVTPTLGALVGDALRTGLDTTSWWLYVFPAAVIVVMLLCVNYVGDSLDHALNPRRT